jgi:hypothetical protein
LVLCGIASSRPTFCGLQHIPHGAGCCCSVGREIMGSSDRPRRVRSSLPTVDARFGARGPCKRGDGGRHCCFETSWVCEPGPVYSVGDPASSLLTMVGTLLFVGRSWDVSEKVFKALWALASLANAIFLVIFLVCYDWVPAPHACSSLFLTVPSRDRNNQKAIGCNLFACLALNRTRCSSPPRSAASACTRGVTSSLS